MARSESPTTGEAISHPASVDNWRKPDQIFRSNLSQQITEGLRDDIVHGRIPAGTHLVQDELCERFGTSRMPVRDALRQLTHEGLLQQQGHQRVVVPLGGEDLEEVNTLVAVLHGWAAGRAAAMASDAELADLDRIYEAELETDDPYTFGRLAMELHRRINYLAHSPRLIRTLVAFQQTAPRTMPFYVPDQMTASRHQHGEIIEAIRARDSERAEHLTREHTLQSVALLMQSLEGHDR